MVERAQAPQLYGVLQGTGLFADLGLRAWHVHNAVATVAQGRLRPMRGAPPEVAGSGEIHNGLPPQALVTRDLRRSAHAAPKKPKKGLKKRLQRAAAAKKRLKRTLNRTSARRASDPNLTEAKTVRCRVQRRANKTQTVRLRLDSEQRTCAAWCEPIKRSVHCGWCRCQTCSWCV